MTKRTNQIKRQYLSQKGHCIWCGKRAILLDYNNNKIHNESLLQTFNDNGYDTKHLGYATLEHIIPRYYQQIEKKFRGRFARENHAMAHDLCNKQRSFHPLPAHIVTLEHCSKAQRTKINLRIRELHVEIQKSREGGHESGRDSQGTQETGDICRAWT